MHFGLIVPAYSMQKGPIPYSSTNPGTIPPFRSYTKAGCGKPGLDRGVDCSVRRNENQMLLYPRAQEAEAQVVVPVAWIVPVPIS